VDALTVLCCWWAVQTSLTTSIFGKTGFSMLLLLVPNKSSLCEKCSDSWMIIVLNVICIICFDMLLITWTVLPSYWKWFKIMVLNYKLKKHQRFRKEYFSFKLIFLMFTTNSGNPLEDEFYHILNLWDISDATQSVTFRHKLYIYWVKWS